MICPRCKKGKMYVNGILPPRKTFDDSKIVRRRRQCRECGRKAITVEYVATRIDPKNKLDDVEVKAIKGDEV